MRSVLIWAILALIVIGGCGESTTPEPTPTPTLTPQEQLSKALAQIILDVTPTPESNAPEATATPKPKPFWEAVQIEFADRGFEYYRDSEFLQTTTEEWHHPDGGELNFSDDDDEDSARLTVPLSGGRTMVRGRLTDEHEQAMKDFVVISVSDWVEGEQWVSDNLSRNLPIALNDLTLAYEELAYVSFVDRYHKEIVGSHEKIEIRLMTTLINFDGPLGLTISVTTHD